TTSSSRATSSASRRSRTCCPASSEDSSSAAPLRSAASGRSSGRRARGAKRAARIRSLRSLAALLLLVEATREVAALLLATLGGDLRDEAARLARLPLLPGVRRLVGHAHLARDDELDLELAGLRALHRAADLLDL